MKRASLAIILERFSWKMRGIQLYQRKTSRCNRESYDKMLHYKKFQFSIFFKPFSRNSLRPFWDFGKCDASQPPCAVEPHAYTVATPSKPRDLQCAAWPRHHKFHKGAWRNEAVLLHRSFFRIIVGRLWSGGKIRTQWKCNQAYVWGIIWTQFSVCRAFHRSHWLLRCKPHSQRHQWKIMRL